VKTRAEAYGKFGEELIESTLRGMPPMEKQS
jgi:hypothetical protein